MFCHTNCLWFLMALSINIINVDVKDRILPL